jgi:outer membrane protein TolC
MKSRYILILILMFFTFGSASTALSKTINIGMVVDGNSDHFEKAINLFSDEIKNINPKNNLIKFPKKLQISGNWDINKINNAIDFLMSSNEVDMIITIGEVSSHKACKLKSFKKPLFAASIIDAKIQRIPFKKKKSGVNNLNYINTLSDLDTQIKSLESIKSFSRPCIVTDEFITSSIPMLEKGLSDIFSVNTHIVSVKTSADDAVKQIPYNADAVFILRIPRFSDLELKKFINEISNRKLPVFSFRGQKDVEAGALAAAIEETSMLHLARSIAVNVLEVIDGANPGALSTSFTPAEKITINMNTARLIHLFNNQNLPKNAEFINIKPETSKKLNINIAMQEALAANLDLAAARQSVTAGYSKVNQAKSSLLPQLNIESQAVMIDRDRAKAYSGTQPQRHWTGSLKVTQLIYSEKARAGFEIENHLQTSRKHGLNIVRLDIMQAAANSYINVLRARTIEKIQAENLKLTQENLNRANIRMKTGAAGPEEVYRWQSQISGSKRNLLKAQSISLNAITHMNNLLNRPLREKFDPQEKDFTNPMGIIPDERFTDYMDNSMGSNHLEDFLLKQGLDSSPELKQLNAFIDAKERDIKRIRRELWVPDISLFGSFSESISKTGAGSKYPQGMNDSDWSTGIQLSLPLYSGGGKRAQLNELMEKMDQLKYQRDNLKNNIKQKILNSIHMIRASYPGIRLSYDAANAAKDNLKLVADSYSRGLKSIIDLIDAQNQALVANQQAANAVYDFIIDLISVQRSAGNFFLFTSFEERSEWIKLLENETNNY